MPIGEMHMASGVLGHDIAFSFYVPGKEFEPPYPAILQLHGAGDDNASWFTKSMLPHWLGRYPFVVICPAGGRSFWSNFALQGQGTDFEDFLIQELMSEVGRIFPVRSGRWAIGGLSMGGFGAIRLGLTYPDRFASIYAHSSAVWTSERLRELMPEVTDEIVEQADVYRLLQPAIGRQDLPALTFDCGEDDFLIEDNRTFHRHLDSIGFPHQYREFSGAHTWEYWNEHVQQALARHAEVLGVERR
jgi:S-formylglutathione hydrolase FrmB